MTKYCDPNYNCGCNYDQDCDYVIMLVIIMVDVNYMDLGIIYEIQVVVVYSVSTIREIESESINP